MYILIVNQLPLGRALAATLVDHGHEVAYLDKDAEYCNAVASELGCLVINGDPSNLRMLQEAGIERADAIITLLERDIENIMVGLFARQHNVPKILARLRQQHYRAAYQLAGITDIFSAFEYLHNELIIAVENPEIRHVMALGSGQVEIAAIDVAADSPLLGQDLTVLWQDADFPIGAIVLGLLKASEQLFHLPRDRQRIDPDDEVLLVASHDDVQRIARILNTRKRRFLR